MSNQGVTRSERFLHKLCSHTFLRLWCYPNLYRDQGKQAKSAHGKELCDMLVVFDKHVIIFSDKECKFSPSDNADISWNRWYNRAIRDSAKQLLGARRWISQYPSRIFTDRQCSKSAEFSGFPIHNLNFHLICVARGAEIACKNYYRDARGSLIVTSMTKSDDIEPYPPFMAYQPCRDTYIHIMDGIALEAALRELDTIKDFVEYLQAKERLVTGGTHYTSVSEEDLLAKYMYSRHKGSHNAFKEFSRLDHVTIDDGFWKQYTTSQQYLAKKNLDQSSYFWDELIEEITYYFKNKSLLWVEKYDRFEMVLRALAWHSRFERRVLSNYLHGVIHKSISSGGIQIRTILSDSNIRKNTAYVFIAFPDRYLSEFGSEYRSFRKSYTEKYLEIVMVNNPKIRYGIAIGTNATESPGRSHDIGYMNLDLGEMTAEYKESVLAYQKDLGLYNTNRLPKGRVQPLEYPKIGPGYSKIRFGRNDPCPCGSGLKYKKCCMR